MTDCKHSWRHVRSAQYVWEEKTYSQDERTIFGFQKSTGRIQMRGRIDEFYCSICLDETRKIREYCGMPDWWSDMIEVKWQPGRPVIFI